MNAAKQPKCRLCGAPLSSSEAAAYRDFCEECYVGDGVNRRYTLSEARPNAPPAPDNLKDRPDARRLGKEHLPD